VIEIVAAGYGAGGHARHFVAAVHGIFGGGGGMLVMMAFNRALAGGAATAGVRGPRGAGKRGEKKDYR
jgi:hypothetical protein